MITIYHWDGRLHFYMKDANVVFDEFQVNPHYNLIYLDNEWSVGEISIRGNLGTIIWDAEIILI